MERLIKIQLMIFAAVTVISVALMAIFYLRVPTALGIGKHDVKAQFVASGGLYQNANVTYRGVQIGRVTDVALTPEGVTASMRLNNDVKVPGNVRAVVKSVSAIGEQYVDLVPPPTGAAGSLRQGDVIGIDRTAIPTDVSTLLRQADGLVNTVADTRLREVLSEAFKAFNGSGQELSRLIDSSRLLIQEANADYGSTTKLIDQVGPLLDAQIRSGDNIRGSVSSLAALTEHFAKADPQLRQFLKVAPGAAEEASELFAGIRPSFPVLAASLANLGRVGVIYNKSIEQSLVILPALFSALLTVAGGAPMDEGAKLDFRLNLGDPPPCLTGFVPAPLMRTPADETLRELPRDMYCKTAQNDPSAVRGARNYPCQEFPGKRAPTIQLCRDPRGYVPVGSNPWRGPPAPYGTPVEDPRNILPPNKFPNIPPGAEPDPGTPTLPPPPPPAPEAPPAGGDVMPVAAKSEPMAARAYDPKNGVFLDANNQPSVYAPALDRGSEAETWADLMLGPKPA
ncbi:Mce-family protein, Mce4F [Mycolicibacterium phlei]|uniref:MCE family protein n=1 Tax=Mycobacteroides chelonae TaxID=1774 RepID=UPI000618CDE7|nr:MCE family protein [Mycobacteroides chelonae]VEG20053.1 Mce-family protein, Mce4F [Mycolicibacterium phlei]AKC40459.1 mammalian cell entry protein [Mycobacteroides chelonae]ANB00123.1 mammalian cell entry protein [Mycobacteroides chelonae CCUG 47445]OLT82118.1 mammalian cell entry protein [Mycobacteroides chelonae]ORV15677.1 mammalian cell entry protein [Mycobacteroides chelonae]